MQDSIFSRSLSLLHNNNLLLFRYPIQIQRLSKYYKINVRWLRLRVSIHNGQISSFGQTHALTSLFECN